MSIVIREYKEKDLLNMIDIWNEVVEEGNAFPQKENLDYETAKEFFGEQTYVGVAEDEKDFTIYGIYILHPNNVGRCGHISNASYAVSSKSRGLGIGERLVRDSLVQGKKHGFKILQFNAVVATNTHAKYLYDKLGFQMIGTVKDGFLMKDGNYEDICLYYYTL